MEGRRRCVGGLWWLERQLCTRWVSLKNKRKPRNKCINCRWGGKMKEEQWWWRRRETDCVCWLRIPPAETDERPHNYDVRGYKNTHVDLVILPSSADMWRVIFRLFMDFFTHFIKNYGFFSFACVKTNLFYINTSVGTRKRLYSELCSRHQIEMVLRNAE